MTRDDHAPLTVPHIDEHDGRVYETPSIINTDDGKEAGWTSAGEKEPCR